MTTHKARFSLLTPNLMRLQYAPFDERPSMRVMTRPDAIAFSETIQEGDTVIHDAVTFDAATLRGDHITLRYRGDDPLGADNLTIEWRAGGSQGVWTPNTADLHNLGGTVFRTLAAVAPALRHAAAGRGVHLWTFNDYLARRDAEWMGPLYRCFGLGVAAVCAATFD